VRTHFIEVHFLGLHIALKVFHQSAQVLNLLLGSIELPSQLLKGTGIGYDWGGPSHIGKPRKE
jgi:hypothetical protein